MFRTGHKNEPTPDETPEPRAVEPAPVERPAGPAAPAMPHLGASAQQDARLGRGVRFDGTLRFAGTLVIEGSFHGHILDGDSLVIGDGAKVNADVSCGSIEVSGEAQGSLTATRAVELKAPARVSADVTTPSLKVAEGAVLDGTVKMRGASAVRTRIDRTKRPARIEAARVDGEATAEEPSSAS